MSLHEPATPPPYYLIPPTAQELFDAVEFDDRLGRSDVMYDLAFLLMDLWHRDHRAEANRVLNRYLLRTGDYEGLGALPLFLSLRAGIRAHVSATMAEDAQEPEGLREEARQYMQLALGFLSPPAPMLIGVGGFSGSGKSTVAAALAPSVGPAPGAVCLRSDELRKVMHGVEPQDRLPPQAYDPSVSRRVYAELRNRAGRVLQQGHAVIADAVHDRADSRSDLRAVADEHDAAFKGFWLSASEEAMAARIEARHGDASDADASVMRAQLQRGAGKVDWLQLSAGLAVDDIAARAVAALPSDCVIEDG